MRNRTDKIKGVNAPESDLSLYIQLLKAGKQDFRIIKSNYTVELISDLFNIKLNTTERGIQFFQAQKKIIKDIETHPETTEIISNEQNPRYFKIYNLKEANNRLVYAFDLTAAYPTTLKNMGLISDLTFNYLMTALKKSERLPAVGSIASKKTIQYFYDGILGDIEIIENKYRPVFFHIVETVFKIMDFVNDYLMDLKINNTLFSWVDCIYIDMTDASELRREILTHNIILEFEKMGFICRPEILENFNCVEKKHYYKLTYNKKGNPKVHNVPKSDNPFSDKAHKILFGD